MMYLFITLKWRFKPSPVVLRISLKWFLGEKERQKMNSMKEQFRVAYSIEKLVVQAMSSAEKKCQILFFVNTYFQAN